MEKTASPPGLAFLRRLLQPRLVAVGFGALGLLIVWSIFTEYVRPYEAGIKVSRYGGGVADNKLDGGRWYYTGPGVSVYTFPTAVQALEMTDDDSESALLPDVRRIPRVEVDTSDGSKVAVDVTVLYRIDDPHAVLQKIGPGRLFEDSAVIPKAVLSLKKNLGQLLAKDFYHESKRVERCNAARDEMSAMLKDVGISVDHVLVRQYYYQPAYQQLIENRKVQDQLVFTNQSKGEAAKEDAARQIEAEGQASADVEKQRGEAEVTKIRAEAQLYKRKRESEGDMLVQVASAKGTQLVNGAYASAGTSDNLVALEMAKVLDGLQVIVISDPKNGVNPLDIEQMVKMFGAH